MKFLLAADNFTRGSGGAPRSAQELVRALLGAGHKVAVLETGRPGGKMNWEGADHFRAKLHGPLMPADRDFLTVILNPRWRLEVAGLLAAFRPQLVITQGMLAPGAIGAARAARVPVAYFFRGYAPLCPLHYEELDPRGDCTRPDCWKCLPLVRRVKYPLVRGALDLYAKTVPHAEVIVANSNYVARLFEEHWKVKAEVVPPALKISPLEEPANDPGGYLLFVKPQRAKGLEVFAGLATMLPDRKFAVAGELSGTARRRLRGLSNVEMLGWREDMPQVYRGARLLLGPSRIPEPFGRVFAEAAAVGLPSLAYGVGGVPQAVAGGGLLLPPSAGAQEWARTVRALDEGDRYEGLRRAALGNARDLAASGGVERVVSLLERAAESGPAPLPPPPVPGRRLKVVQVISAMSVGGAELSLFHLATRLDREKFEVRVVCLREEGELAARLRQAGVPVELHKLRSRYSPLGLLSLAQSLARSEADVVHTHLRRPNTSGRIAAWLADTPVIVAHERNPGPEKTWRHFLVDRWLARVSSAVIAVSGQTAERNSRLSGIPIESFTVIPNAVDLEEFGPGDRAGARGKLEIADGEFVVGFAGRLHGVKMLDVLMRAFAAEAFEGIPTRLVLAGDGPQREELQQLARELSISDRVSFLGRRDDMAEVYPAMDVLCLVSRSEGCSRVMLEAAACGLPLVLTPVGYAPEMLEDGISALFVPAGEVEPLAAALGRLAADAELRRALGAAAHRASGSRGLEEYVKSVERVYLEQFHRATTDPAGARGLRSAYEE